jgi:AraC-like DNA-binding protein
MIEHPLTDTARYQAPSAFHRLAGLLCIGYGSVAGRAERTERPALASYGVLYVYAGSGWVETAATVGRIGLEAGALVWLFPGVEYTFTPGPSGWSEQWALFEGPMAQSFEHLGLLSRVRPVVQPQDQAQITALFDQLRADFAGEGSLAGLLGAAVIHRLVVEYGIGGVVAPGPPSPAQAVQRAVALIDAWALQPLDLRAVAEECGVGYSTLRRRFKQETGQSITDYVLRRRLDRARELLVLTSMSVAEVARAVGFVDPYYFSRVFHLKEGLSPTAFRTQHRHLPTS